MELFTGWLQSLLHQTFRFSEESLFSLGHYTVRFYNAVCRYIVLIVFILLLQDQLGDVLHWTRQATALLCGLIWGAIPLVGGFWFML